MHPSARSIAPLIMALVVLSYPAFAEVPQLISYQGVLQDNTGAPVPDGDYQITFTIYEGSPPIECWTSGSQTVAVKDGLFQYQLGSAVSFHDDIFAGDTLYWLGIKIGADPELSPRIRLVSTPYAYVALRSDTAGYSISIADNSVTDAKIVDGAIINDDINGSADISVEKISGTAVNLTSAQTISGDKTFTGTAYFGDSTMIINNDGVMIGRSELPASINLLKCERLFSTTEARYGLRAQLYNDDAGELYGVYSDVYHHSTMNNGNAYGLHSYATSDGPIRYGAIINAKALTGYLSTGVSYGIHATGWDGAVAYGIYATADRATTNWAGWFEGNARVTGTFDNSASRYVIDHPVDPGEKYLFHNSVSSPDMKNIYDGVVVLDGNGEATVVLPGYFDALNRGIRYQLTCVGHFAPVYIEEEIFQNRFKIAGGDPGMKVSWQITGIRRDPYAAANGTQIEIDKREYERDYYLNPDVFGFGAERSIHKALEKAFENRDIERSE